MDTENLVHMANRIGEFFQAMPERAEALEGIATHLKRFWAPGMRHALAAHLDSHDGAGLLPIVREALLAHRALLG
jgi:formate dehydrogenase subunit delta